MTGPKDSSRAMNMWSCTSVKTVGSKKKPGGRRGIRDPLVSPLHRTPATSLGDFQPHASMAELLCPPPGAELSLDTPPPIPTTAPQALATPQKCFWCQKGFL